MVKFDTMLGNLLIGLFRSVSFLIKCVTLSYFLFEAETVPWSNDCQMLPLWKQHPVQHHLIFVTCTTCTCMFRGRMKLFCHYINTAVNKITKISHSTCVAAIYSHQMTTYSTALQKAVDQTKQKQCCASPHWFDLTGLLYLRSFSSVSRQRNAELLHLTASLGFWGNILEVYEIRNIHLHIVAANTSFYFKIRMICLGSSSLNILGDLGGFAENLVTCSPTQRFRAALWRFDWQLVIHRQQRKPF